MEKSPLTSWLCFSALPVSGLDVSRAILLHSKKRRPGNQVRIVFNVHARDFLCQLLTMFYLKTMSCQKGANRTVTQKNSRRSPMYYISSSVASLHHWNTQPIKDVLKVLTNIYWLIDWLIDWDNTVPFFYYHYIILSWPVIFRNFYRFMKENNLWTIPPTIKRCVINPLHFLHFNYL